MASRRDVTCARRSNTELRAVTSPQRGERAGRRRATPLPGGGEGRGSVLVLAAVAVACIHQPVTLSLSHSCPCSIPLPAAVRVSSLNRESAAFHRCPSPYLCPCPCPCLFHPRPCPVPSLPVVAPAPVPIPLRAPAPFSVPSLHLTRLCHYPFTCSSPCFCLCAASGSVPSSCPAWGLVQRLLLLSQLPITVWQRGHFIPHLSTPSLSSHGDLTLPRGAGGLPAAFSAF